MGLAWANVSLIWVAPCSYCTALNVQLFVPHYYQSKMSTGAIEKAVFARAKLLENDEGQPHSANAVHVGWTVLGPCSTVTHAGLSTVVLQGPINLY